MNSLTPCRYSPIPFVYSFLISIWVWNKRKTRFLSRCLIFVFVQAKHFFWMRGLDSEILCFLICSDRSTSSTMTICIFFYQVYMQKSDSRNWDYKLHCGFEDIACSHLYFSHCVSSKGSKSNFLLCWNNTDSKSQSHKWQKCVTYTKCLRTLFIFAIQGLSLLEQLPSLIRSITRLEREKSSRGPHSSN